MNPVREALRARLRPVREILFSGRQLPGAIAEAFKPGSIAVRQVLSGELDRITSSTEHQGVMAWVGPYPAVQEDKFFSAPEPALIVVCDGVTDPRNLGAIVRSACLCGAAGVVVPRDHSAGVTPVTAKASAGAIEHTPVAEVVNLRRFLEQAKEAGFWIAGLDMAGDSLFDFDVSQKLVLVIGGEGAGMRRLTRETCDFLLRIPQLGPLDSFNASAAAAAAMVTLRKAQGVWSSRG
ncbi:MAG: putative TrmH family tRNA/rRNA methyltransferase [Myxococcota bacterium]|nr:putative TrmH family tRNA/rRNA methyltransferase [Myxococcota bacterium]